MHAHASSEAWIGASDAQVEGAWRWAPDGGTFWLGVWNGSAQGGAFTNWESTAPNDFLFSEDCGVLEGDGKWDDEACTNLGDYICESTPATASAPQAPDTSCTRGTRNGHDYWFCSNNRTFDQAERNCRKIGMDLASIDDQSENGFVTSNIRTASFVGLSDQKHEGSWKWAADGRLTWCGASNGRLSSSTSYTNWDLLQPLTANCRAAIFNGHTYWFCSDLASWDDASKACQSVGMSLARVDDANENAFLRSNIWAATWLAGTDRTVDGDWRWSPSNDQFWTGGLTGHVTGSLYTNWQPLYPVNGSLANCAAMQFDLFGGLWTSDVCDLPHTWVCEGPLGTGAAPELPDLHDCATLNNLNGAWASTTCDSAQGYVCETAPRDAGKSFEALTRAVRDDYRTGKPRVSYVAYKDQSLVTEPF